MEILNIDLDGVVYDWHGAFADYIQPYFQKGGFVWEYGAANHSLPEPTNWQFFHDESWGAMTFENFFQKYTYHALQGGFYEGNIIEGSKEALEFLDASGFYIRIVTHRLQFPGHHGFVQRQTAQWLDDFKVPYHDIIYLGKAGTKDGFKCFASLDDKPANALADNGYLFDRRWNRDVAHPRRVNWERFVEQIIYGRELSNRFQLSNTSN